MRPPLTNASLLKVEGEGFADDYTGAETDTVTRFDGDEPCYVRDQTLRAADTTLVKDADAMISHHDGIEVGDNLTISYQGSTIKRKIRELKPYMLGRRVLGWRCYFEGNNVG